MTGMCKCAAFFSPKSANIRKSACFLLALFCFSHNSECQTGNSNQNADIYKNFSGRWIGYNESTGKSAQVRIPLEIVITEEKNGKSMRFDYTYGRKGEKDFERITRYVELQPADAVMSLRDKGQEKMTYRTDGLDQFAKAGLGRFTAQQQRLLNLQKDFLRGTFELQEKTFFYQWERSADGVHYTITGVNSLTRDTSTPATK
jgi:hypothetical protein